MKKDGERVQNGDILAVIEGRTRAILTGERVALNISRDCPVSRPLQDAL